MMETTVTEYPGLAEAAAVLAESQYTRFREVILEVPAEDLEEGFEIPAPWSELHPIDQNNHKLPFVKLLTAAYPALEEAIRSDERTKMVTALYGPKVKETIQELLPDAVQNKDLVSASIVNAVDEAQSDVK